MNNDRNLHQINTKSLRDEKRMESHENPHHTYKR